MGGKHDGVVAITNSTTINKDNVKDGEQELVDWYMEKLAAFIANKGGDKCMVEKYCCQVTIITNGCFKVIFQQTRQEF